MTMRLDIVTNDAGELVRREHARELGAGVVVAIYRLAKLAQMHDLGNQAFVRQLEQTHQLIGEYCLRSGSNVSVLFAEKATFVAGQLLKGNRGAYEAASELGALLERIGGSELHISRDVTREDLLAFAEQLSLFHRTGNATQLRLPPKIHLRRVADVARLRGIELEELTPDQRIVRAYASAVVIMRRFFEDLAASRYILPRRIKRIAQSLVDLSDANTASYLGVTEARNANYDEAGRAVNTAILAVAIARETTQDRTTLAQIAMAAMMHDVARPRALALAGAASGGLPGMAGPTMLSEDQEDRLPAGAAAVLTALGRVNEPSITRTVLTFEALWLRRRTWLGPVYWGARAPTLHASIIAVARRYNDLLTPEPGLPPPTPDFAVATLANELTDAQDRTVLRMLVSALGLLPTGTVVQLSTGEVAEVIRGARGLGDKPRVAILADASGVQFAQPIEVELAEDPRRTVHRVLSVDGWRKGLEQGPQAAAADDEEAIAVSLPPPDPVAVTERPQSAEGAEAVPQPVSPAGVSPLAPHLSPGPPPHTAPLPSWDADDGSGSGEPSSSASLSSLGSSPSAVAEAMGRIINDSLAPPAMSPREANQPDRTVFQPRSPDDMPIRRVVSSPLREPTARGNLAATPLPHVLVYMLDHSLTGSVVFEGTRQTPGGVDDTIYFVNGVPAKIRLDQPVALLGQVLVEDGSLDPKVVDQAVEGARRLGILLGEYLVGHEMVSRDTLAWALEGQMLRKIAQVAKLAPEVEYAYYRDVDLLDNWGGDITITHPLNPILASVRHWTDRSRIRATLNRIGNHPLVLHADSDLSTLAVLPDEQKVLDAIRGQALTLPQLFNLALCDEEVVSSLIYSLAVTRQFAFKGQKKGPMAARGAAWRSIQPPASGSAPSIPSASGTVAIPSSRQAARPPAVAKAAPSAMTSAAPVPPPPETPRTPAGAPRVGPPSAQMREVVPPPGAPNPRPLTPAARPQGVGPGKAAPQIRPVGKKTIHGLQPAAPLEGRPPASVRQPAAPPAQGSAPDAPPTSARPRAPVDDAKTIAVTSPVHELMAKHGPAPAPPPPGAGRPPIKPAGPPGAAAKPRAAPPVPPGARPAPPGVPPGAKSSASGVKPLGPVASPPGAKSSVSNLKAAGASASGAGAPSASGVKAAAPVPLAPSSSGKALAPGGAPAAGAKAPQKPLAPTAGKAPPLRPSPAGPGGAKPAEGGPRATGANPPAKVPMAPATLRGIAPAPSSEGDVSEAAAESAEAKESAEPANESDEPEGGSAVEVGEAGLADAEAALEAMTSFRLAEGALQRNDRVAAEEHAKKAVAGDPTQPDYIALLAWIRSLGGEPQLVDEAIRTMSKILIEDPSNEKALFYRAKLLVKTNRLPEALNDFNELLAANPNHREAQNEARLLRERLPQ
jgi:hypothetical protein